MITTFTRNDKAAVSLDRPRSIELTGMYIGTICQAEIADTPKGATYVEFAFKVTEGKCKDADGTISDWSGNVNAFVRNFILSKTQEKTFGQDILDAIMVIVGVEKMDAVRGNVFNYDRSSRPGYLLPALKNKRIGFLLQRENYLKNDGTESHRMNLVSAFDPDTKRCAKEIIEGATEAKLIERRFKTLTDKQSKQQTAPAQSAPAAYADSDMADDVPY